MATISLTPQQQAQYDAAMKQYGYPDPNNTVGSAPTASPITNQLGAVNPTPIGTQIIDASGGVTTKVDPTATPLTGSTTTDTGGTVTANAPTSSNPYLNQVMALQQLSPAEVQAQQQLNTLQSNATQGQFNVSQQPIAQGFISGQQSAMQTQANIAQQPLQLKLALAQSQRQAALDAAKTGLGASMMTLPYGSQIVDATTGKVVNGGIFGNASGTGGTGINPATNLKPTASSADIMGYLSANGINVTRYDAPGLINAVQNGYTAQDIISGKANVAGATSAASTGSGYAFNPANGTFGQRAGGTTNNVIGSSPGGSLSGTLSGGTPTGTNQIKAVQQALGITADGINGPQTRAAVKAYQAAHGLTVDGIIGPQTLGSLGLGGTGGSSGGILSSKSTTSPIPVDPYSKLTSAERVYAKTGDPKSAGLYPAQIGPASDHIAKVIPGWSPVTAQAAAKFYESTDTQKFIANSNTVLNTINDPTNGIKALSNKVDRSNITVLNNGQFALLRATSDPATAKFVQQANIIADEISKLLGSGQGSDFAIQLGQTLVNPAYSQTTFNATMDNLDSRVRNKVNEYLVQGGQTGGAASNQGATVSKGTMSNADFVEKALSTNGWAGNYQGFVSGAPQGTIPVILNSSGQPGYIPEAEFNSSTYTRV